jgi:hypothetical protein
MAMPLHTVDVVLEYAGNAHVAQAPVTSTDALDACMGCTTPKSAFDVRTDLPPHDASNFPSYYKQRAYLTSLKKNCRCWFPQVDVPTFNIPPISEFWLFPPPPPSPTPWIPVPATLYETAPEPQPVPPEMGPYDSAPNYQGVDEELAQMFAGAMDSLHAAPSVDTPVDVPSTPPSYNQAASQEVADFLAAQGLLGPAPGELAVNAAEAVVEDDLPTLEEVEEEDDEDEDEVEDAIQVELEGGDMNAAEQYLAGMQADGLLGPGFGN